MSSSSEPNTLPFDLDKLLKEARPELEAADSEDLIRRLVLRARVTELTDITLRNLAPLIVDLDKVLTPELVLQRKLEFERLYRRAWVFYAADLAAEEMRANTSRTQRRALAKRVADHDRFLLMWATPMFSSDPVYGPTLRDISRGTGLRDDAEDVLRLVAVFRENWETVGPMVPMVTEAYLDEAADDATKQLEQLRQSSGSRARQLADVAYTLWYRDYVELIELGRYLCRRESDVLQRFPGVREQVFRTSEDEADEAEALDDDATEATAEDAAEDAVEDAVEEPAA